MVRISMDSINPKEEIKLRRPVIENGLDSSSAYNTKLTNIDRFLSAGVFTAVQTVVWQKNPGLMDQMIDWLSSQGIRRWYLQRLIPSHKFKNPPPLATINPRDYHTFVDEIALKAHSAGIECIAKMDLRHNSVFLLTASGTLYTQGSAPGQKVRIGMINQEINYYDYVSSADHARRYYLIEPLKNKKTMTKHK
jgi:hypothetical protein